MVTKSKLVAKWLRELSANSQWDSSTKTQCNDQYTCIRLFHKMYTTGKGKTLG